MTLKEYLEGVRYTTGLSEAQLEGIQASSVTNDSRQVRGGSIFVCIRGGKFDGHEKAADALAAGADLRADERTAKHADWAEGFKGKYTITADNALEIVQKETGLVFAQVLEHAGVYKRDEAGREAFLRVLRQV